MPLRRTWTVAVAPGARASTRNKRGRRAANPTTARRALGLATALLVAVGVAVVPTQTALAASGDLAFGVVRVDADNDGTVDTGGAAGENDLGVGGVAVTLYDSTAPTPLSWTTTTASDGSWSFVEATVLAAGGVGPFTVRIDTDGVGDDAYAASTAGGDFTPLANPQQAVSDEFAAGAETELDALVYPVWAFELSLANDPDGLDGQAVYTGTAPWDDSDTEDGEDTSADNDRVRSGDLVAFNWSITVSSNESLGDSFTDAIFEQTITLSDGAVANFDSIPAACDPLTSELRAFPSDEAIDAGVAPPTGTTSVVLTCNLGEMGEDRGAVVLPTSVLVLSTSENGSTFTTSSRVYGVDSAGTATAQPADGPEVGPIEITAAPRYDLEKTYGGTGYNSTMVIDGVTTQGVYTYYGIMISTDRETGVEAFEQPISVEESFWANQLPSDLEWYIDLCQPTPGSSTTTGLNNAKTVVGKLGSGTISTEANSVVDSGSCSIARTGAADTGNYTLTFSGIDTSGTSYPTETVSGAPIVDKYYVASYRIRVFIPLTEFDRADGVLDGAGSLTFTNRVGDFDPDGLSGASNFGSDVEPGYCAEGPTTDQATNCAVMEDGTTSNNVAGPASYTISPGAWSKVFYDWTASGWALGGATLPGSGAAQDGAGQVQPGQAYTSQVSLVNTSLIDWTTAQFCDVFDSTVLELAPLDADTHSGTSYGTGVYAAVLTAGYTAAANQANQANWVISYGHVDLSDDDPNSGVFDTATNRYEGDWTEQKAAASGTTTACGSSAIDWYTDPTQVPGGIDGVNVVWARTADGVTVPAAADTRLLTTFEQRDTYNGGPHDGETIPSGTVSANFAAVKTSSYNPNWSTNSYIPGAGYTGGTHRTAEGTSYSGDRWTVTRAAMALSKRTVAGTVDGVAATGVADYGVTGNAVAGRPVIWEITAAVTAASSDPAEVQNVVITDTLPEYVSYNEAATAALSDGTPASSYTVNADGTTTLVWNLGAVTPNAASTVLKIVTDTDPLAPNNTTAVNTATVTADGIPPISAHTDTHAIRLEQTGELQLKKSVDRSLDLQDDTQQYTLQVKNFSANLAIQNPTVIEVLPYNGDSTSTAGVNRSPASDYSGTNTLSAAPQAFDFDGTTARDGTFYYTTVDPASVPQHLSDDTDASIWTTTFTADATAIKFVASSALTSTTTSTTKSGMVITFTTAQEGNEPGDLYADRFTAFSSTFTSGTRYQLLTSNQTTVRVLGFSLGDLVWYDVDGDGVYTAGTDRAVPEGVTVQVRDSAGSIVDTATTDADGRWIVNDLAAGQYYVTIPASEFASGGLLAGAVPGLNPVADPDTDLNEDIDHHAIADGDGVRSSGLITLSADTTADPIEGLEPLSDNVGSLTPSFGTTDAFTNLTLDLALVPAVELTVAKVVDGDGAEYGTGPFTVEVSCTFDGSAVAGFPQTLTFDGAGEQTLLVPLGSECSASETGDGGATEVAIDPEDGITIDDEESDWALTVTNTFDVGSFEILKETAGAGVDLESDGREFVFQVACTFNGTALDVRTVTVADDGSGSITSEEITGIPVGASCVITETDTGYADETPDAVQIVIDDDQETVQIAGLLNEFSAGEASVVKILDGDAAEDEFLAGLQFEAQARCQVDRDGELVDVYGGTLVLTPGEPLVLSIDGESVLLPVGTRCWIVEESVDQGATEVELSADSYENGVEVLAQDDPDVVQELSLTVTNTFDQAEFTVSKTVDGPGSGSFTFVVSCEYEAQVWQDAQEPTEEEPDGVAAGWSTVLVEYPLAESDATFQLSDGESRTIAVLAGVDCAVTEDPVPTDATVTASSVGGVVVTDDDGVLSVQLDDVRGVDGTAAFTNSYPALADTAAALGVGLASTGVRLLPGMLGFGVAILFGGALLLGVALIRRRNTRQREDTAATPRA
ncbi:MAG: DUF5979 domain-containing protein [Protaetiibacter sp.]